MGLPLPFSSPRSTSVSGAFFRPVRWQHLPNKLVKCLTRSVGYAIMGTLIKH
jgi:hypothetical protein